MARTQPKQKKEPAVVTGIALTPTTVDILAGLRGDATDSSGRRASGSAVIRALLRYANQQGYDWVRQELVPLIEAEQRQRIWGSRPR